MASEAKIRQPIITVAGHVDHGKTSILDALRNSSIAKKEAGNITQKISFTSLSVSALMASCPLIDKQGINLEIPGFLFIDTPGHAAFNNLRKRGGSLADLAILVIDINEGIKPQTMEVLQILKLNKTPFIIALNKVDKIRGWTRLHNQLKENLELQPAHVKQEFDEKIYTLIGALNAYGFEPELFYKRNDFSRNLAVNPCSAKTSEGIQEILLVLCGLSQKFLRNKLLLGDEAKGVVLEIKKEKNISFVESILYDGTLTVGEEIAIASFNEPIIAKVKSIQEIQPVSFKFKTVETVSASSGIRMQLSDKIEVLPGMPFIHYKNEKEVRQIFKEEISSKIQTDKKGIIIKADSLGSLEAMIFLLKQYNIKFVKAGIGPINKADLLSAKANLEIDPIDAVVLGFNVSVDDEAKNIHGVKIIIDDVIYKLIENLHKFREEKSQELERERLTAMASIAKIEILHQHVFRNTNPAIFGVRVAAGKMRTGMELIDENGEVIGRIKNIQSENKSIETADEGMEVAISIPGVNFERKLGDEKFIYSNLSKKQFNSFKNNKDLLSSSEIHVLQEIKQIKKDKGEDFSS